MNTTTSNGQAKSGRTTTINVKKPTRTEQPEEVTIEGIETITIPVTIVQKSPLIANNFGQKMMQQLEDERALTHEQRLAIKKHGKKPITTEEINRRFQAARLLDSKGRDCVRASWVKGALVTAATAKDVGIQSTILRGILYVEGDLLPITFTARPASESDDTITHFGKGPAMRRDVVRVGRPGAKQPDLRYRPQYDDWSVSFRLTFEPKLTSLASVYHLIRRAGTSVGLCEWRPRVQGSAGHGGDFGRFDLKAAQ
jgi:hypothetical protein